MNVNGLIGERVMTVLSGTSKALESSFLPFSCA